MSNPFAGGGDDPFAPSSSAGQQPLHAGLKPARRAPPRPAAAAAKPSSTQPAPAGHSNDDDDPFGLLAATGGASSSAATASRQQQGGGAPAAAFDDDDVFGLFAPKPAAATSAAAAAATTTASSSSIPSSRAPPPPPPPSYADAGSSASLPPPPAYEAAAALPPPPPSYEQVMAASSNTTHQQQQQQQQQGLPQPTRAAPAAPPGPLTAAKPARPAPPAPGGRAGGPAPARAAPPPPPAAAAAVAGAAGSPSRPAPRPPLSDAAAAAAAAAQQQLSGLALSGRAAGGWGAAAATVGNVGAAPKGSSLYGSQQLQQGELCAQLRLPPLNPKASAPLKALASGLGSLFAGPAAEPEPGSGALLLQWSLGACASGSGSTLPAGAAGACPNEDHDTAAAAALTAPGPGSVGGGGGRGAPGRVSCLLLGRAPAWLWAGATDGRVHCWAVAADGSLARHLHSWAAHNGKVKALALSPCGRLFTGSSSGSIKMWGYSSPAGGSSSSSSSPSPPRLLRQLRRIDPRSGVASDAHSKVVGLAVGAGGRVLWSVGKASASLWSTHNGEHLGSLSESGAASDALGDPTAAAASYGQYSSPYTAQLQAPGGGGLGAGEINPRQGLDLARLDAQFERPSAELLAEEYAQDDERDPASVAYNAAVKGAAKAGKLFNKLTKVAAAHIKGDGRGTDSAGASDHSNHYAGAGSSSVRSGGSGGEAAADAAGLAGKVERWGSIKKLAACAADGSVWLAYKRGLLEKYSEAGRLLWSSGAAGSTGGSTAAAPGGGGTNATAPTTSFRPGGGITALAAVGGSVWVGDQEGRLWVLDAGSCALQRCWKGHVFPVAAIAPGGHLVHSLGKAGSIRSWPALAPPPELTAAWRADAADCLQQQALQVLVGTWNVNETKPSRAGLELWLGDRVASAHLVMIGLQEVEMGTGSVALDVVYQNLAKSKLEAGTQAAQAWVAAVGEVLASKGGWKRVALRQMSGILAMVFARAELEPHIGEVATASVACGVMGYGGNKGAVAISFSLFRRRLVLVSSHFAAHQDKVDARNADYAKIVRHLHFHNVPSSKAGQQQQFESSDVVLPGGGSDSEGSSHHGRQYSGGAGSGGGHALLGDEDWGAGMKDAELLVWVGDFNYRVDTPDGFVPDLGDPERPANEQLYRFVLSKIASRQHTDLLSGDQCSREMARGAIFHGLAEGPIRFLPTYKFEKARESSAMQPFYDQGEKMRVPAWTDRIFFRGSAPQRAALAPNPAEAPADVRLALASQEAYWAVLEVNDSDHKPVYAQLALQLPWFAQQQLRSASLQRLWQVAELHGGGRDSGAVHLSVQPQQLVLTGSHVPGTVVLTNSSSGGAAACFVLAARPAAQAVGDGPRGAAGPLLAALPPWLEVTPAVGVIPPGQSLRVKVLGSKGAAWGGAGGVLSCELAVVACAEGSIDSSMWPGGLVHGAPGLSVTLP